MRRLWCALLAGALLLSACADAEKLAEKSLGAIKADWDKAGESLDPQQRVRAYEVAVEGVESLAKKYKKTQIGAAVAAGRTVGGVSRAASIKDQRPFFAAFSEDSKPSDFPKVLMAAHDALGGEALGYVIDAAIRRLDGE